MVDPPLIDFTMPERRGEAIRPRWMKANGAEAVDGSSAVVGHSARRVAVGFDPSGTEWNRTGHEVAASAA
jgi:hypothetical protein